MKYEKLARFIIKNVGGEKNINIVQHCACLLYTSDAADE